MMNVFPEAKKNFGFGCMRLQMKDGEVDTAQFSQMADDFMAADFNYFNVVLTGEGKGGKCEHACPQHLPIRRLLEDVAATFERK